MNDETNNSAVGDAGRRGGLAVVVNAPAPYRVHLHCRLAGELRELTLYSIFTHAHAEFRWELDLPERIHPVTFADPGDATTDAAYRHPGRQFRKAHRIARFLEEHDVRAVILMGYNDLTRLELLRILPRRNMHVFMRGDSNIRGEIRVSGVKRWLKGRLLRRVLRRCAGVMPMGHLGEQYFERYGADPARCFWVPYEPDYEQFRAVDAGTMEATRKAHGLPADRRLLLYSGRLAAVKRVDLLIDAFAAVAESRPTWDLAILGDGELRESLQARVPGGLTDRVHWLGFQQADVLPAVYRACDALVLPSDYEPWALVINEAVAAGLAVVASDVVGAAYELVQDGVNGRVFTSGDLDSLIHAMLDVTDPDRVVAYQRAAAEVLAEWRERADPVEGVRAALRSVGVLSVESVDSSAAPAQSGDGRTSLRGDG